MNIARNILKPIAMAAGWHASQQAKAFFRACRRTRKAQNELLEQLMLASAGSDFGNDHGFAKVRSYEDFVSAVDVGDYEARRPYLDRVFEGKPEALFAPGTEILMYAVTSGTTGKPKHIPVTARFLAEYTRGWNVFGLMMLSEHPSAWLKKVVTIVSPACQSRSPNGTPCGAISGMLRESQKWIVRRMYPVPRAVSQIADPQARYYTLVRSAITHDVGVITTANPSSVIRIAAAARDNAERVIRDVRDGTCVPPGEPCEPAAALEFRPDPRSARKLEKIMKRHGELLPRHFWNLRFLAHWLGGTLGLYLPKLRAMCGDVPIRDIGLLASEGRLSIPLADNTPVGVAEITSNFLEFIPAEQHGSPEPDILRAHEVECGQEYFLVVSNWSGLFRYSLDDRVRVTDLWGDCPMFEFLSRGRHSCSITGEKLTEHQVVAAMAAASKALGGQVDTFVLQGHFADPPYYELRIEPADGIDPEKMARGMDDELSRLNVEYEDKRHSCRLGPLRVTVTGAGDLTRDEVHQIATGAAGEQFKHKYLMTHILQDGTL